MSPSPYPSPARGEGIRYEVKAVWDAEAEVFYSESDIEGLHIEAATLDEFEAIMLDVAPELIMVNHFEILPVRPEPASTSPLWGYAQQARDRHSTSASEGRTGLEEDESCN